MGMFGWIKSIGKAISNGYKKFSGQATFEEADALYEEVLQRFKEHKAYFDKEVEKISEDIDSQVNLINRSKETIKRELFPAFADKMRALKDIPVSDTYLKESFLGSTLRVDDMKAKADLYLIDFKKAPFKNNALAIITLGFATRKKAKETLEKVKEEKARIEEEIRRMDAELTRLRKIQEALHLIAEYYDTLTELYKALLYRLDNSIGYLMVKCISEAHKLIHARMSIKLLPKSQQDEIMALVTISKVLKEMVDKNVTMDGKTEVISENVSKVRIQIQKQKEQILAAAV